MKTVDEIYNLVATNIANSIDSDNWEKAVLHIHGGGTSIGIDGYYIENGERLWLQVRSFDVSVYFSLKDLHKITTQGSSNPWNEAVFTLFPDGKFQIDFDYDASLEE